MLFPIILLLAVQQAYTMNNIPRQDQCENHDNPEIMRSKKTNNGLRLLINQSSEIQNPAADSVKIAKENSLAIKKKHYFTTMVLPVITFGIVGFAYLMKKKQKES